MSVFIIINEWTDVTGGTSSEVVGPSYFESEDAAWEALGSIAENYDTHLYADETSLTFEDHTPGLQSEEYYIQELNKK